MMDTRFFWAGADGTSDLRTFHPEELVGLTVQSREDWEDEEDWEEEEDDEGWDEEDGEEVDWEDDEDEDFLDDEDDDWDV